MPARGNTGIHSYEHGTKPVRQAPGAPADIYAIPDKGKGKGKGKASTPPTPTDIYAIPDKIKKVPKTKENQLCSLAPTGIVLYICVRACAACASHSLSYFVRHSSKCVFVCGRILIMTLCGAAVCCGGSCAPAAR